MRKLKSIFFTLMTMAYIVILTTSCNQTDLTTEEFSETNINALANKLVSNPNFQASIKIQEQIGNDLMKSIEDNSLSITNDDFTSSVSFYTTSENEFVLYKTNLLIDMPELNSITIQTFEEAFSLAFDMLDKQELSSRNCSYEYNICVYYNAYIKYYYGSISYNAYIAAYYACIQQYYNCT